MWCRCRIRLCSCSVRTLSLLGRVRVIERKRTKGGRSRLVPMLSEVQQVVGEWVAGRRPDDLLFPSPEGSFLRSGNWRRTVHWDETCRGRRPHDLRHTAATVWLGAGVDVKTVAAWLGHASTKLTLDTYGHWMGTDADRAAISRLEAALGAPAGDGCGGQAGANGSASRAGAVGSDA
ncbi:tyrosine-type recombinase/integrase [Arsenicicoccus sp. MKL-02]|uniref:Tyrosine-type recombinase/integrase n=1 Tax=Arsenicicoccus cauae TaxID=2663847 RepID=A0A6I3I405_9MICO|nr:site-specific integrase [Arsenicicoccus cauae]MTB70924.1 tyrosine-type recombinase/integrase [Arsenicicoccus cauae]